MSELLKLIQSKNMISPLLKKRGRFCVDPTIGVALSTASYFNKTNESAIVVCQNLFNAQKVTRLLGDYIGDENVFLYPADELLRSEEIASSKEFIAQRLFVLGEILSGKTGVVVTHPAALLRFLPSKDEFEEYIFELEVGQEININSLRKKLVNSGYSQVNKIDQSLQFAVRGDIFDIFSVNEEKPIRIEFFGDEIESIKYFDISTQISIPNSKMDAIKIYPATELIFKEDEVLELRESILKQLKEDENFYGDQYDKIVSSFLKDYEMIEQRSFSSRIYKYFAFAKKKTVSILDYFDKHTLLFVANEDDFVLSANQVYKESYEFLSELVREGKIPARLQLLHEPEALLFEHNATVYGDTLAKDENTPIFRTRPIVYAGTSVSQIEPTILGYIKHCESVILALSSPQQISIFSEILNNNGIPFDILEKLDVPKKNVGVLVGNFDEGFELVDQNLALITSKELFGEIYKKARFSNRFKEATILKSYDDLQPGDYVVHEYRGIGQFLGIETLTIDNVNRDFLHIKYAGTDEIYVPLNQFKLVRKYAGREGVVPKLNSLSGNEWKKTKTKIKQKINELADRLLKLYSERTAVQGFAFAPDDEFQTMFEKDFPFDLTPDQEKAVEEIKADMERPYPMDRLLCGDVGFGKSEVAFRAAFKAINNGKQVALLCPTTLLARQHYEVIKERFKNFGIRTAIFSRLVSIKDQNKYLKEIEEGKINIIVGTHKLLSKKLIFKDLGLLIIDEEQRFGVEQKEKIKELKTNIDVLTLSATPIPRTLQMSLVGIRQLSQINTAPKDRMPIQTYVIEEDKKIVKELIERELARGGQAFYLYNKVEDIYFVAHRIAEQVKDSNVGVVHGQMNKDEIEDVMEKFYSGEINVLVCTTIIENGIDIPNANLIIIENADTFGLSQLYQIKGRVGRGDRIAYAYLMYKPNHVIHNEAARARLKAIEEFTELGSGYKIAQRDLMIRGAGDILGPEQAGYIDSIGIDLYTKMLNDAVNGRKTEIEDQEPNKMLSINAYIPQNYANNPDKIELYQEIENAKSMRELNAVKAKIRDIYGELPDEVMLLLQKAKIDLYYESDAFDDMVEYPNAIDLTLSSSFAKINGIGNDLFEELLPFLGEIKVSYKNSVLNVRVKKIGDWATKLEKIMAKIVKLYFEKIK